MGSYSPDGKEIAYASTQSGHSEIWVMNADGSDQRKVTFPDDPNAPDANSPSWSPDGSKIAFAAGLVGGGEAANIFTINADGSDRTQRTFAQSSDNPIWSPDGKDIIFETNRNGPIEIWTMNADGSDQKFLLSGNSYSSKRPIMSFATATISDRGSQGMEFIRHGDGGDFSLHTKSSGSWEQFLPLSNVHEFTGSFMRHQNGYANDRHATLGEHGRKNCLVGC
jgi:Tol biopolymer transport system component